MNRLHAIHIGLLPEIWDEGLSTTIPRVNFALGEASPKDKNNKIPPAIIATKSSSSSPSSSSSSSFFFFFFFFFFFPLPLSNKTLRLNGRNPKLPTPLNNNNRLLAQTQQRHVVVHGLHQNIFHIVHHVTTLN